MLYSRTQVSSKMSKAAHGLILALMYHSSREVGELQRLLDLVSVCPSKQQLPSLEVTARREDGSGKVRRHQDSRHLSTEALSLEEFRLAHVEETVGRRPADVLC